MKFNKKLIPPILTSVLITVCLGLICYICLGIKPTHDISAIDEGWTISIDGKTFEDISFTEFYKSTDKKLSRGSTIIVTNTLPVMSDIPFPAMQFRSRYTTLDVYVDDELLYSFGNDIYENNKFLGKMYHFIPLPSDFGGKTLRMEMRVAESDAFSSLAPVLVGSHADLRGKFVNDHMLIIFTSMFLVIFGIAFACITVFFINDIPSIRSFFVGALLCINLGAWLSTYYNVLALFIYTETETQIEYFTMYLILPYLYLLVYFIQQIEKKKLYLGAGALCSGITLIQYFFHYILNIHMRATLPIYHVACILSFGLIIYYLKNKMFSTKPSSSSIIQLFGTMAFIIAEMIHILLYFLDTMHIPYYHFLSTAVITGGCLTFALCQLGNYLLFVTEYYAQKREYASLSHLAYADGLTNLPNRARSDKEFQDLDELKTDYCIISIDLNGLKIVNDKFGHPSGDKYIKDFSKVLISTFGDVGMCARIGGDEFLVIIRDSVGKDIELLLGRMDSALNVMNALYPEYRRSVATGHAFRHECGEEATSHEVYLLADQRMYEKKRKMHEELGIKNRL